MLQTIDPELASRVFVDPDGRVQVRAPGTEMASPALSAVRHRSSPGASQRFVRKTLSGDVPQFARAHSAPETIAERSVEESKSDAVEEEVVEAVVEPGESVAA